MMQSIFTRGRFSARPLFRGCCAATLLLALAMPMQQSLAQNNALESDPRNPGVPWPATDGLGRSLVMQDEAPPPREGRFVGIFYFLWNGYHDKTDDGPFVVSQIMEADPDALDKPDSPLWGPQGAMHFWDEPLYGYYRNADPWVLRRHAHLLAAAGVDTLIFDTTNRVTYNDVYMKLLEVFAEIREEGGRTPQVTFMTNTRAGETARELYEDLYEPGRYEELWFRWEGKPFLIADPAECDEEIRDFFTLRKAHWPFEMVNTENAWHWEATHPQPYGYTDDPDEPEQVNVSVAQNLRRDNGKVTNMSLGNARGRSFHDGEKDPRPGAVNWGFNMQEQFEHAIELDPPFVMVTGWNEWIAGRYGGGDGPVSFVDQFDQEYSRDIEMAKASHKDNYYYQLVDNVRHYKGMPALPEPSEAKAIEIGGDFSQWDAVEPAFEDAINETQPRDHPGVARLHYTNETGRNDFRLLKVARDEGFLYFYAETREPITSWEDDNWMWLMLNTDGDQETGWQGYDYIANFEAQDATQTSLARHSGDDMEDWAWEEVAQLPMRVEGNRMHLYIPREALELDDVDAPLQLDFKWADNLQAPGDIMDFYLSGDVAPLARFNYRYQTD